MSNIDKFMEELIFEINMQLVSEQKLEYKNEELLSKEGSKLDSLALLSFISILEEKNTDYEIDFMEIIMAGDEDNILETVGSLKKFLLELK